MSSLILVSPRKTGKIVPAVLDGTKFKQVTNGANGLGSTCRAVEFFGSRFWVAAGASANILIYAPSDPEVLGAKINGSNSYNTTVHGVGYGDDDATIICHLTSSTSNAVPQIWVSYDFGASFTIRTIPQLVWRTIAKGVLADGTPCWIAGSNTAGGYIVSVDNGWTWTATKTSPVAMGAVAYHPVRGKFIAASNRAARESLDVLVGGTANWPVVSGFVPTNTVSAGPVPNRIMEWVHDRMIALEGNGGNIIYSFDGITWQEVAVASGYTKGKVIYADGLWVIILLGYNVYASSVDFVNWTVSPFPAGFVCHYGAYGNGKFMFASQSNTYYLTYDLAS